MIKKKPRTCRECPNPLHENARPQAEFCCTACRIAWRNRRASRGAELYDVVMAMRFDRTDAKDAGMWALMCRMASEWNEEDKAANRQTYFPVSETRQRLVRYAATKGVI